MMDRPQAIVLVRITVLATTMVAGIAFWQHLLLRHLRSRFVQPYPERFETYIAELPLGLGTIGFCVAIYTSIRVSRAFGWRGWLSWTILILGFLYAVLAFRTLVVLEEAFP